MEDELKVIDIGKVIRESNSVFLNNLPGFVINIIEKIIHQDEMNETINKFKGFTGTEFVNKLLHEWNITLELNGTENLPETGRYIFVANHPVGAIDSLAFLSTIARYFSHVISPSNELFEHIPNLRPVIVGINVFGRNTKETAEKLNDLFESDTQIMIFPSGEVSRREKGIISDPVWQKSFITKAVQYKRDVIPVHISGRNSNLFYNVATLRKFFGIRMYVETILLPHEMMKQKNTHIKLTFGKSISHKHFTGELTHIEWAQQIKKIVYELND